MKQRSQRVKPRMRTAAYETAEEASVSENDTVTLRKSCRNRRQPRHLTECYLAKQPSKKDSDFLEIMNFNSHLMLIRETLLLLTVTKLCLRNAFLGGEKIAQSDAHVSLGMWMKLLVSL